MDISDPGSPVVMGETDFGPSTNRHDIALFNGFAYVAANTEGLKVYSLPDSANPALLYQPVTIGDAYGIAVGSSSVYTAGFPASMSIYSLQ
jgi:hypothetical protein